MNKKDIIYCLIVVYDSDAYKHYVELSKIVVYNSIQLHNIQLKNHINTSMFTGSKEDIYSFLDSYDNYFKYICSPYKINEL